MKKKGISHFVQRPPTWRLQNSRWSMVVGRIANEVLPTRPDDYRPTTNDCSAALKPRAHPFCRRQRDDYRVRSPNRGSRQSHAHQLTVRTGVEGDFLVLGPDSRPKSGPRKCPYRRDCRRGGMDPGFAVGKMIAKFVLACQFHSLCPRYFFSRYKSTRNEAGTTRHGETSIHHDHDGFRKFSSRCVCEGGNPLCRVGHRVRDDRVSNAVTIQEFPKHGSGTNTVPVRTASGDASEGQPKHAPRVGTDLIMRSSEAGELVKFPASRSTHSKLIPHASVQEMIADVLKLMPPRKIADSARNEESGKVN